MFSNVWSLTQVRVLNQSFNFCYSCILLTLRGRRLYLVSPLPTFTRQLHSLLRGVKDSSSCPTECLSEFLCSQRGFRSVPLGSHRGVLLCNLTPNTIGWVNLTLLRLDYNTTVSSPTPRRPQTFDSRFVTPRVPQRWRRVSRRRSSSQDDPTL